MKNELMEDYIALLKETVEALKARIVELEGHKCAPCTKLHLGENGIGGLGGSVSIPAVFSCQHTYSRAIQQEYPRKCTKCGTPEYLTTTGTITIGCIHDYPSPWYATIPPNCKKCGQQAPNWSTITCQSDSTSTSAAYSSLLQQNANRMRNSQES